jgi:hypothetical protein
MLKELKDYNNFASPQEIKYLLANLITKSRSLQLLDLKKICSDYSIDFAFSFDGTLVALDYIAVIKIEKNKVSLISRNAIVKVINSPERLGFFLSEALFEKLKKENLITEFLNHECLGYDLKKRKISIKSNLIPLEFTGFFNFLTRMNFFTFHDTSPNVILINDRYQKVFENRIIPLLRKDVEVETISTPRKELSYEQFKRILQLKENLGFEAEQFVFLYELKRLVNHNKKGEIKIISSIDVWSGYDIVSFNSEKSEDFDRFIEVKSYSSELKFYWSKNEVDTARVKGNNYYLYLVDREKKEKVDYCPIIIQNPYEKIYSSDDWVKDPQEWIVGREALLIRN